MHPPIPHAPTPKNKNSVQFVTPTLNMNNTVGPGASISSSPVYHQSSPAPTSARRRVLMSANGRPCVRLLVAVGAYVIRVAPICHKIIFLGFSRTGIGQRQHEYVPTTVIHRSDWRELLSSSDLICVGRRAAHAPISPDPDVVSTNRSKLVYLLSLYP
ncbi:hypothetical protein EVAR_50526_1 [Eumeta japonica]|uniref:Uncharacterized protein n=1 Tax=Eumeta variegata TaxID=151549 RepID=A0A4C1X933_EUMVA|nr:hypothetical protein EVAR_50526_1 [Eumeta japonica]